MALASTRPAPSARTAAALLLATLALAGCSEGDNDDNGKLTAAVTVTPDSSGDASSGASAPTTTEPAGTSAGPDSSTGDQPTSSSTAAASSTTTTGEDTTTGDTTTGESTGPICDPGQGGCVCDDGMCVDGYACEDGVCAPALMCPGDIEPDDNDEETAKSFGDITDNDDDAFTISGILGGAEDTDWYTYHGKDTFGYIVEPKVNLLAGGLRLCQFLVCDAGGAAQSEVTCPAGTKFAISPNLRPGCCAATTFQVTEFNCTGQDESATIWIRVDQPLVDACTDYEIKVTF
jgi:hypothetical protein